MTSGFPAQQAWVCGLTIMQQSVLFAAIRAPDGIRKDHPAKVLLRWYRRCILVSAFDGKALTDPFVRGGGSFTGPYEIHHAAAFDPGFTSGARRALEDGNVEVWDRLKAASFDSQRDTYLRHVDELPHHFQLHFMHAAEIVGFKHPDSAIRTWWREFYEMLVNDAHLFPETEEQMDERLSDFEPAWRAREKVFAR